MKSVFFFFFKFYFLMHSNEPHSQLRAGAGISKKGI